MTEPADNPAAEGPTPRGPAILVATDFSRTAEAAADWAASIARGLGARVHLLHVLTLPAPQPHYTPAPSDLQSALQDAALEQLSRGASRLAGREIPVETDLQVGIPSQTIVRVSKDLDPVLLVIGTRGLTGLSHLLLGSTAERVVQRAECPVLTIHPEDVGEHRPIETILVPTDFSEDAKKAVRLAHRLLSRFERKTRLVLLHAFNLPIEYTAYGPIPTSVNYLEDAGIEAEQQLGEIADELRTEGLEVETVAREGYPPEVICQQAEELKADLIAMGTHGRSGLAHLLLGSTAERVVQKAPCPVMTIRCEHREEDGD